MPKKRKGERWKRINKKILSELEYLDDFEQAVETSIAAAEVIATNVARTVAAGLPDKQAEVKASVERALLRAAPSEAAAIARQTAAEVLGAELASLPEIILGLEANSLIGGTIEARAEMYVEATYATYENNVLAREMDEGVTLGRRILEEGDNCEDCIAAATDEFVPLSELPEIGDSVCMSRCRCEFEFGDEDASFRTSELFSGVITGQDKYGGSQEIN
jgi:hypothetical protein